MEQYIYLATCTTSGCRASFLGVDVISETLPDNVVCGSCGSQITNIQETGALYADDIPVLDEATVDTNQTES